AGNVGDRGSASWVEADARKVLHVLRYEERASLEDEHAQVGVSVDLFGAIGAEHPGSDHYRVELDAAIVDHLVPRVADEAPQHVDRQCGVLKGDRRSGVLQSIEHGSLLLSEALHQGFHRAATAVAQRPRHLPEVVARLSQYRGKT